MPSLTWDRRHNVACLTVSFAPRIWDRREVGDLVLGYAATGRLARVVFLDPRRTLPLGATVQDAVRVAMAAVRRAPWAAHRELAVLESALARARSPRARPGRRPA